MNCLVLQLAYLAGTDIKIAIHWQVKGLSTEELTARNDLVLALPDRIQAIPDGTVPAPKQSGGWGASASRTEIKFDSGDQYIWLVYIDVMEVLGQKDV